MIIWRGKKIESFHQKVKLTHLSRRKGVPISGDACRAAEHSTPSRCKIWYRVTSENCHGLPSDFQQESSRDLSRGWIISSRWPRHFTKRQAWQRGFIMSNKWMSDAWGAIMTRDRGRSVILRKGKEGEWRVCKNRNTNSSISVPVNKQHKSTIPLPLVGNNVVSKWCFSYLW